MRALALFLILTLVTPSFSKEKERPSCDEVLSACEVYVQKLEDQIKRQEELLKEASKPTLPFWFWTLVGAAATTLIITIGGSK